MSLAETLHREHLERRQRFENAGRNPKPAKSAIFKEYAPRIPSFLPPRPRKFDPAEELAWMIVIEGYIPKPRETVAIDEIIRAVCRYYKVSRNDLLSPRRTSNLAFPRQVGAYLARRLTQKSFPEIGRRFGGRDHATQIHASRKIAKLVRTDEKVACDIATLIEQLGGDNAQVA